MTSAPRAAISPITRSHKAGLLVAVVSGASGCAVASACRIIVRH